MICSILSPSFLSYIASINSSLFTTQRSYSFVFEIIQCQVDLANHLFIYWEPRWGESFPSPLGRER